MLPFFPIENFSTAQNLQLFEKLTLKTGFRSCMISISATRDGGRLYDWRLRMTQQERRLYTRYHAPESLVTVADFPTKAKEHIQVQSISFDGLCFVTKTDISGESIFSLSLKCDDEDAPSLDMDVSAKIVWHIHDETSALHTAGVQFLEPDKSDRDMLREFLDFLESCGLKEMPPAEDGAAGP
jgi:hypothetical protein